MIAMSPASSLRFCAGSLKMALLLGPTVNLNDLAVGRGGFGILDRAAREERSAARHHVVDFSDFGMVNRRNRSARRGLASPQNAHRHVMRADVDHFDLPVCTYIRRVDHRLDLRCFDVGGELELGEGIRTDRTIKGQQGGCTLCCCRRPDPS